ARKITSAKDGVADFAFSRDGNWLVYRAGKSGEQQLYRLPVASVARATTEEVEPEQLTKQTAGVGSWELTRDSRRIYFITADTIDADEKQRREKKFTVDIRNAETPLSSLWALDLDPVRATRLTSDASISVSGFQVSPDGGWVGFRGVSADRYKRNITEEGINSDLFLLEVATGGIERLTRNEEVGENGPFFTPDSRTVAFIAPDDMTQYSMTNRRAYVRPVEQRGGEFRKLGTSFDGDIGGGFFSEDGRTYYFNAGIRAT